VILADVNVLVNAFHEGAPEHSAYRAWLASAVASDRPFAISEVILSGFVRVATHPRIFNPPASAAAAFAFVSALRTQPNAVVIAPSARHWEIFERLSTAVGAKGSLIADAYLAALAIDAGCEWITADRDFARFPGLRWRHPLSPA